MEGKMKSKNIFNSIVAAFFTIIFSVLGGCESTPKTGRGTSITAGQLAREINTINRNSATVNGDTVTLLADKCLEIKKTLVVPEGVILDVTAKDARLLLHGGTLIVDGTINAGANQIAHDWNNAGYGIISGSGIIRLMNKGYLFLIGSDRDGDTYTLTLDGVTLDGLTRDSTDNDKENNDKPLIQIEKGGEFIMKSGLITGNTNSPVSYADGGGMQVKEGGTFIMEGGSISGNAAYGGGQSGSGGGGIRIDKGTFIMKGGTISNNKAGNVGGGVLVMGNGIIGSFTMLGGTISGNTVTEKNAEGGGGVCVGINDGGGIFTMVGGTIYGSSAQGGNANTAPSGAALMVSSRAESTKWGTDGIYTKGGVNQIGGSNIGATNDTLIAVPEQ